MDLDLLCGFARLVAYVGFVYYGISYYQLKKVVNDYRLVNVNFYERLISLNKRLVSLNKRLVSLLEEKYKEKEAKE